MVVKTIALEGAGAFSVLAARRFLTSLVWFTAS